MKFSAGLRARHLRAARIGHFWYRLSILGAVTGCFVTVIYILPETTAWPLYYNEREMLVAAAVNVLTGIVAGAGCATVAVLFCLPLLVSTRRFGRSAVKLQTVAGLFAGFVCGTVLVRASLVWFCGLANLPLSNFRSGVLAVLTMAAGAIWLYGRRSRRVRVKTEFKSAFTGRTTRRAVMGLTASSVASVALAGPAFIRRPVRTRLRADGSSILLITFDALTAEHMSLYGYHRRTTANIDSFARTAATFDHYYSCSTYTTPAISGMISGRYPSSTHMIHLKDKFRGADVDRTLSRVLHNGGYATAAVFDNPWAHLGRLGLGGQFDELPPPTGLSHLLSETAARQTFLDALVYRDIDAAFLPERLSMFAPKTFKKITATYEPAATFSEAERILQRLDGPYFLWVHAYAPHFPYQPSPPFLHRFLPNDRMRSNADYWSICGSGGGGPYPPQRQPLVDLAACRYDEWIAQADAALGDFLHNVHDRLDNTVVAISADHGESFAGGMWSHGGARQLRPILHVPLIVRAPGQANGLRIPTAADHTSLAPTLLALAGIDTPPWMQGSSLAPLWGGGDKASFAFTEFLDLNSAFGRLANGTVGAIDGQFQYVVDLASGRGQLFDLAEAHLQSNDRTAEFPDRAHALRSRIIERFPDLTIAKA